MDYILFGDIVEDNGRTIRENNEQIKHNYKVGDLVEVKYDEWHGDGACSRIQARLWIVECGRDCDGTPLYWLSPERDPENLIMGFEQVGVSIHPLLRNSVIGRVGGFSERSLTPVEITEELKQGHGSLRWEEVETFDFSNARRGRIRKKKQE